MGSIANLIARPLNEGLTFGGSPQDAQARMTLQQMAGQQAIQKQVQQENALKLQAQQEDQNDQQTIQEAMKNNITPDGIDFDKVQAEIATKVKYRNLQGIQEIHNKLLAGTLAMDNIKRERLLTKNTSIGNEVLGLLDLPQDQRAPAYAAARQRLIKLGDIDPNDPQYPEQLPLDDATLTSHLVQVQFARQVQTRAKAIADEEKQKELAAKAKAKADADEAVAKSKQVQQSMEDAARDYLGAQITDQAGHDAWLADLQKENPEAYKRMPKKFVDAETTSGLIQSLAQTSQQRADSVDKKTKADAEARRALIAGGETGLAFLKYDPTVSTETNTAAGKALADVIAGKAKAAGGLTANEAQVRRENELKRLSSERNRFQDIYGKGVAKWNESKQLGAAIDAVKAGNPNLKYTEAMTDPLTGKQTTVAQLLVKKESADAAATALDASAREILRQNQWGEFAPGAQQSGTPPPRPASIPATAKARYSPSKKAWQYSTDGGATWLPAPAQ